MNKKEIYMHKMFLDSNGSSGHIAELLGADLRDIDLRNVDLTFADQATNRPHSLPPGSERLPTGIRDDRIKSPHN